MNSKLNLRSAFTQNLIAMVSGTAVAQVINFLFSLYLTRIYSAGDFGMYSFFFSVVSFITVIACGKFDVALVATDKDEDVPRLFALALGITFAVSLLTLFFALLADRFPISFLPPGFTGWWLYMIPVSVFLLTAAQVFWMWNVRAKNFRNISFIRILEAVFSGSFSILFRSLGSLGLLAGAVISSGVSFFVLGWGIFRKREGAFPASTVMLKDTFRKYAEFPRINIPQGFVDIFQVNIIVIFITAYYVTGIAVAGFYALCMRVLQVPMRLIILPLSHVFFAEASEVYRNGGDLHRLVIRTIWQTALVALPVPLVVLIWGPDLFALLFGEKWREAGLYARIFAPWIFVDLVRAPLAQVASILNRQRAMLRLSVINNLLLALVLFSGAWMSLPIHSIFMGVSLSQSLLTVFMILLILRLTGTKK